MNCIGANRSIARYMQFTWGPSKKRKMQLKVNVFSKLFINRKKLGRVFYMEKFCLIDIFLMVVVGRSRRCKGRRPPARWWRRPRRGGEWERNAWSASCMGPWKYADHYGEVEWSTASPTLLTGPMMWWGGLLLASLEVRGAPLLGEGRFCMVLPYLSKNEKTS